MRYILDTSVILQWYHRSGELHPKEAKQILDDLKSGRIEVSIPNVLPLELLNALIKGKGLSVDEANQTLNELFEMPIKIIDVTLPVLELAATLMERYNLASYDAYFLALAKYEQCILISDDQKAHGQIKDGSVVMLEGYQIRS